MDCKDEDRDNDDDDDGDTDDTGDTGDTGDEPSFCAKFSPSISFKVLASVVVMLLELFISFVLLFPFEFEFEFEFGFGSGFDSFLWFSSEVINLEIPSTSAWFLE